MGHPAPGSPVKQVPFGDDRKKSKGKDRKKSNGD
jgi:hypothetical protein